MKNRVAVITGSNGHLGSVIAETLAEIGSNLILVDKPNTDFPKLKKKILNSYNINIFEIKCDLEIEEERVKLSKNISKNYKEINCLVNCAAYTGSSDLEGWNTSFEKQSLYTWRKSIELNLTACFHLSQLLYPKLKISNGANIINISSIYGELAPNPSLYAKTKINNPSAYSISKGGLNQLTKWLSTNLSPKIRVNAIAPGGILRNQDSKFIKRYISNTPLKRMATETDFKGAVAFLASDLSNYVTGQIIKVDGGWGVW